MGKIKVQSKYISLNEALTLFESEEALLLAVKEGQILAWGRKYDSLLEVDLDQREKDFDDFNRGEFEPELSEIPSIYWADAKVEFSLNKISKQWTYQGGQDFYSFNDVSFLREVLESSSNVYTVESAKLKTGDGSKQTRWHTVPLVVGKAYQRVMEVKKDKPTASELWSYLVEHYENFNIHDYIACHGDKNEAAFQILDNIGNSHYLVRRRFDTLVSEYRTGSRELPVK